MPSRMALQRRLAALETVRGGDSCPSSPIDWSGVTDAELDRLEGLAMQAETYANAEAFRGSLSPGDREWLDAFTERLGIALAVGGTVR